MSPCDTLSSSSCALCHNISTFNCNLSFSRFRCLRAASALSFSILIVDSCSSNLSFLSSIPNCMIRYCLLSIICSLINRDRPSHSPSHSSSANATNNLLKQLGRMTFWHSVVLHSSKLSSFLRHFEQSLHVFSMWLVKKIIFKDNKKPILLEVTFVIALFLVSTNQI